MKKFDLRRTILNVQIFLIVLLIGLAIALLFTPVRKEISVDLAKYLHFQKQVSIELDNAKTIPDTYHSIDQTIQEVVKKANEK